MALRLLPDPLGDQEGPHPLGLRQDESELLPGEARGHVDVANLVLEENRHLAEQDVPHQLPVTLIDLPEVVDVEVEDGEVQRVALGSSGLLLERREEVAGVPEPGLGVGRRGWLLTLGQ